MNKEIELRSLIDTERAGAIYAQVAQLPDYKKQARCFVDYSTFTEGVGTRILDVRVRMTNSIPELIVKRGQFGAEIREEASIAFSEDQLEAALSMMHLLGYSKGVAGGRRIHRGTVDGIEVALQEVLDFKNPNDVVARFVEVEAVSKDWQDDQAIDKLTAYLAFHGLDPMPPEDWNTFVEGLNATYNGVYEHGSTSPDIIRALGR